MVWVVFWFLVLYCGDQLCNTKLLIFLPRNSINSWWIVYLTTPTGLMVYVLICRMQSRLLFHMISIFGSSSFIIIKNKSRLFSHYPFLTISYFQLGLLLNRIMIKSIWWCFSEKIVLVIVVWNRFIVPWNYLVGWMLAFVIYVCEDLSSASISVWWIWITWWQYLCF